MKTRTRDDDDGQSVYAQIFLIGAESDRQRDRSLVRGVGNMGETISRAWLSMSWILQEFTHSYVSVSVSEKNAELPWGFD